MKAHYCTCRDHFDAAESTGINIQRRQKDLGLPCGPSPGKELLDALDKAIAAGDDMYIVDKLRKQAEIRRKELHDAGLLP